MAEPTSVFVDTFGTAKRPGRGALTARRDHGSFLRPGSSSSTSTSSARSTATAAYGHFGRKDVPWEQLNRVEQLKEAASKVS
jgi:S-adenosylmethionine synthetase